MKVLELFSGAGGATEGLLRAGFDVVRCIEWDRDADATAKAAGHPSVCGDVRDPAMYEGLPAIDLVWISPPCPDWSTAGLKEGAGGVRNGWPWAIDALDRLKIAGNPPKWVILENVTGMLNHTGKCRCPYGPPEECAAGYLHRWILPRLRDRFTVVDFRELDAADYGVPQHRRRIFIVCGPVDYRWPEPTHADPSGLGLFTRLMPWVGVRAAIGIVGVLDAQRNSAAHPGQERPITTDEPCFPIGTKGNQILRDASGVRRLTAAETAILQGFPAEYPWRGTWTSIYRQIGNAVPPPVAETLARALPKPGPVRWVRLLKGCGEPKRSWIEYQLRSMGIPAHRGVDSALEVHPSDEYAALEFLLGPFEYADDTVAGAPDDHPAFFGRDAR